MSTVKYELIRQFRLKELDALRTEHHLPSIEENQHFTITGPIPECCIQLAESLADLLNLPSQEFKFVNAARLLEPRNSPDPYEELTQLLSERSHSVIGLSQLSALLSGNNHIILNKLEEALQDQRTPWSLILIGTQAELRRLLELSSGFASYFPVENRYQADTVTLQEWLLLIQQELNKYALCLSQKAQGKLIASMQKAWKNGLLYNWTYRSVALFVRQSILSQKQALSRKASNN